MEMLDEKQITIILHKKTFYTRRLKLSPLPCACQFCAQCTIDNLHLKINLNDDVRIKK